MIRSCLVVDDFLPQPERFREAALKQEFGPMEFGDHSYDGFSGDFKLMSVPGMAGVFARVLGFPFRIEMDYWRVGVSGDRLTSWIHCDAACGEIAAILYLSEPAPGSGTAFWKHRELGWHEAPEHAVDEETNERLIAESHDGEAWEMTDLVHGRYNRLVIYPARRFHSRYPKDAEGDSPEDGRLIWVGFANRENFP